MVCKHNLGRDQYIVRASQVVLVVKNLRASVGDARDMDLTPGLGRSPGVGNGNPLQYSCLENPTDREAWQATVHSVSEESDATEHATCTFLCNNDHK